MSQKFTQVCQTTTNVNGTYNGMDGILGEEMHWQTAIKH